MNFFRNKLMVLAVLMTIMMIPGRLWADDLKYDFDYTSCVKDLNWEELSDYIEEAWWDRETLKVVLVVKSNCAVKELKGEVALINSGLAFRVQEIAGNVMALCDCNGRAFFEIKNIEKKDYLLVFQKNDPGDKMELKVDNTTSDYCDHDPVLKCYADVLGSEAWRVLKGFNPPAGKEGNITFKGEEYQEIAGKYPEFLEYVRKEGIIDRFYDIYEFRFDEKRKRMEVLKSMSNSGTISLVVLPDAQGSDFKQAVQNYISSVTRRYQADSLSGRVQVKVGVPVVSIAPNYKTVRFNYNGEVIKYGFKEIGFEDRANPWTFRFAKNLPAVSRLTQEALQKLVAMADTAYQLMRKDGRFDSLMIFCDIDQEKKSAQFWAHVVPDDKDSPGFLKIHSQYIRKLVPVEKHFAIDLQGQELKELQQK